MVTAGSGVALQDRSGNPDGFIGGDGIETQDIAGGPAGTPTGRLDDKVRLSGSRI